MAGGLLAAWLNKVLSASPATMLLLTAHGILICRLVALGLASLALLGRRG